MLVHSLVKGGTAERDGNLRVGDLLVHVNHTPISGKPLEFAVEQLRSIPLGSVAVIGVNHPLFSPEGRESGHGSGHLYSPISQESFLSNEDGGEGVGHGAGFGTMVGGAGDGYFFGEEGTQSTVVGAMESRHTQEVCNPLYTSRNLICTSYVIFCKLLVI